jgi:hypothetical protein
MELFRLKIKTDTNEYSNILVEYPNIGMLSKGLNDPGGNGYRLLEILSFFYPDVQKVEVAEITSDIKVTDTVIRYNLLQDLCEN